MFRILKEHELHKDSHLSEVFVLPSDCNDNKFCSSKECQKDKIDQHCTPVVVKVTLPFVLLLPPQPLLTLYPPMSIFYRQTRYVRDCLRLVWLCLWPSCCRCCMEKIVENISQWLFAMGQLNNISQSVGSNSTKENKTRGVVAHVGPKSKDMNRISGICHANMTGHCNETPSCSLNKYNSNAIKLTWSHHDCSKLFTMAAALCLNRLQ